MLLKRGSQATLTTTRQDLCWMERIKRFHVMVATKKKLLKENVLFNINSNNLNVLLVTSNSAFRRYIWGLNGHIWDVEEKIYIKKKVQHIGPPPIFAIHT